MAVSVRRERYVWLAEVMDSYYAILIKEHATLGLFSSMIVGEGCSALSYGMLQSVCALIFAFLHLYCNMKDNCGKPKRHTCVNKTAVGSALCRTDLTEPVSVLVYKDDSVCVRGNIQGVPCVP